MNTGTIEAQGEQSIYVSSGGLYGDNNFAATEKKQCESWQCNIKFYSI